MNSDDESSDSSNEFLVPADKLNLNDTFFNNAPSTSKTKQSQSSKTESDNNSSDGDYDDDDFICPDNNVDTNALLVEVMKNLEKSNAAMATCFDQISSISLSSSKTKTIKQEKTLDLKSEITELLLKGESGLGSSQLPSDIDDNTEKVDEQPATAKYSIPKEGVNITLPGTRMVYNRKKKGAVDLQAQLIKRMNQRLRLNQLLVHEVGLLCWLAHGFHLNRTINDPEIMAILLSLIPSKIYPNRRVDIKYVEGFTNWFRKCIKIEFNKDNDPMTKEILFKRLKEQKTHNYRELVLLFIAALRAMGINCRLIISLCPPPMKLKRCQLFKANTSNDDDKKIKKEEKDSDNKNKKKDKNSRKNVKTKRNKVSNDEKKGKIIPANSGRADNIAKEKAKKKAVELLRSKFAATDDKKKLRITRTNATNQASRSLSKEDIKKSEPKFVGRNEIKNDRNCKKVDKKDGKEKNLNDDDDFKNITESEASLGEESSSEDSDLENFKKKRQLALNKKRRSSENRSKKRSSNNRKVLSSDDEEEELIDTRDGRYLWVEVYVESEESWISVSIPDNKVHCVSDIYKKAPTPVLYIIAWNSVGTIKDVTRRYCPHWLTVTRKQRIDEYWWSETLGPWKEAKTALSKAEDEMLLQMEMEQPLPDSVSKYKGHPLYVLARHLLKFEALYPPDCVPIGHLKNGEAVYSRHCVHTLRSRETWLHDARLVKPKQEPYKIVKALPKHDKFTGQVVKGLPLELFGKWQTTPYDPPRAENGKVPRNEYGTVDLFKQCMLPKGTVHIDLPGLGRIAKKLNIDYANAVVGFNFGCRGAMPKTEGYVVCEEYETILREAWEEEQFAAVKREKERREKRVWNNWRRLIRGLLIKRKLELRYNMKDEDDDDYNDNDNQKSNDNENTIKTDDIKKDEESDFDDSESINTIKGPVKKKLKNYIKVEDSDDSVSNEENNDNKDSDKKTDNKTNEESDSDDLKSVTKAKRSETNTTPAKKRLKANIKNEEDDVNDGNNDDNNSDKKRNRRGEESEFNDFKRVTRRKALKTNQTLVKEGLKNKIDDGNNDDKETHKKDNKKKNEESDSDDSKLVKRGKRLKINKNPVKKRKVSEK